MSSYNSNATDSYGSSSSLQLLDAVPSDGVAGELLARLATGVLPQESTDYARRALLYLRTLLTPLRYQELVRFEWVTWEDCLTRGLTALGAAMDAKDAKAADAAAYRLLRRATELHRSIVIYQRVHKEYAAQVIFYDGCNIVDSDDGGRLWSTFFGGASILVAWDDFAAALQFWLRVVLLPTQLSVLKRFTDVWDDGFVSAGQFGAFMRMFGPLTGCINRAMDTRDATWFQPSLTQGEASSLLAGRERGTYLVRYSQRSLGELVLSMVVRPRPEIPAATTSTAALSGAGVGEGDTLAQPTSRHGRSVSQSTGIRHTSITTRYVPSAACIPTELIGAATLESLPAYRIGYSLRTEITYGCVFSSIRDLLRAYRDIACVPYAPADNISRPIVGALRRDSMVVLDYTGPPHRQGNALVALWEPQAVMNQLDRLLQCDGIEVRDLDNLHNETLDEPADDVRPTPIPVVVSGWARELNQKDSLMRRMSLKADTFVLHEGDPAKPEKIRFSFEWSLSDLVPEDISGRAGVAGTFALYHPQGTCSLTCGSAAEAKTWVEAILHNKRVTSPYLAAISGKAGVLEKQGGAATNGPWQERWVVLREKHLYYYKNEREYNEPRGVLPLASCNSIRESPRTTPQYRPCLFEVECDRRKYFFVADSREDMEDWVRRLQQAKALAEKSRNYHLFS